MEEVDLTDFFLGAPNCSCFAGSDFEGSDFEGKDLKKDMQGYCIFSCCILHSFLVEDANSIFFQDGSVVDVLHESKQHAIWEAGQTSPTKAAA